MENFINQTLGNTARVTNSLRFLDFYLYALIDISDETRDWVIALFMKFNLTNKNLLKVKTAAEYILELGLYDRKISFYHLGLRCAAVLHILRFILRQSNITQPGDAYLDPCQGFPLWTNLLETITGIDIITLKEPSRYIAEVLVKSVERDYVRYVQDVPGSSPSVCFNIFDKLLYTFTIFLCRQHLLNICNMTLKKCLLMIES